MARLKNPNSSSNSDEVTKVVNEIESENVAKLNDEISVAEDGFVHDEELLAGYVDPSTGIRHTTFTYREMNGKDEEAINKADVRSNGGKLVNVLVERCVTEIGTLTKKELGTRKWGELIRNMYGGDLDYMAFKIRELSKGKEVEFRHSCPHCGTKLVTTVNTDEFGVMEFQGLDVIPFTLPRGYKDKAGQIHKEGTLRLMNGFDREIILPMFKKNRSTATTMLITRLASFNDGAVVTSDMVGNMSLRDREYLEKLMGDNTFGVDMSVDMTCESCGADLSDVQSQSNFF